MKSLKVKIFFNLSVFFLLSAFIENCYLSRIYTWEEFKKYNRQEWKVVEVSSGIVKPLSKAAYQFAFESETGFICTNSGRRIIEGSDYSIDDLLSDYFYDSNNNDVNLISGKYLRIVYNGINIIRSTGAGGLGLIPVAKDLSTEDLLNSYGPPLNQVYIDPASCRFILPRPYYWTKCESTGNLEQGDIGSAKVQFISEIINRFEFNDDYLFTENSKFNSGICLTNTSDEDSYTYLNITPDLDQISNRGSVSLWLNNRADFQNDMYSSSVKFIYNFGNNDWVCFEFISDNTENTQAYTINLIININKSEAARYTFYENEFNFFENNKFVAISYNSSQGVKIYLDGVCTVTCNNTFTATIVPYIEFYAEKPYPSLVIPYITFDNIKFWNDEIDYFSAEYNSGTGNEDMLNNLSITSGRLNASFVCKKKK